MTADRTDRELELKFEVPLRHAKKLRRHPALAGTPSDTVRQTSVYFDTPRRRLHRDGVSLRVRESAGTFVQTVKSGGDSVGLFDRSEWEVPVAKLAPDLGALAGTPLAATGKPLKNLAEVTRTEVRRTRWLVDGSGSVIELAFDETSIHAGGRSIRFDELELELKRGPVEAIFDLARTLSRTIPLRIAVASKGERGHDLDSGIHGRVRKATPVSLDERMTVAAAFVAIILACVRHFRLNEDLVLKESDPSALHQSRVAMRRLRAGLSLFRPAIRDAEFMRLRDEIRWFTGTLGDARNLDVFLKRHELASKERRKAERARARAYATATAAIDSQRLRDLLFDLLVWLESGAWRSGKKASAPIRTFAERRLGRQWAKVTALGNDLMRLDEEQLHRLRIEIKKMRYAVEFLGSLYAPGIVKAFTSALESIQETLGALNDDATARVLVESLGVELPAALDNMSGGGRKPLASVKRQLAKLDRLGPFWTAAAG